MMSDQTGNFMSTFRGGQTVRLLVVGLLVLLLKIPIAMIGGLIAERQTTRSDAAEDVAGKWGRLQLVSGPVLVIPFTQRWLEAGENGRRIERTKTSHATFLPDQLEIRGRLDAEARQRGIFSIPVYRLALEVSGRFPRPSFSEWAVADADVAWNRAQLAVGVADARGIQQEVSLQWNGRALPFLPGVGAFAEAQSGIHVPVGGPGDSPVEFSFPLILNGSAGAYFVPFGRTTRVSLASNWASPSFQGNWLPSTRSVTPEGFESAWSISHLGRNYPQAWTSDADVGKRVEASGFGVGLVDPVDEHRMAERSVKYATLFVLLTFASIWLIEVRTRLRVHPIQYAMVGAALCLFYLLELSFSEHLGFTTAYVIASAGIAGMVGAYGSTVLKSSRRAAAVSAVTVALYGYLYVLLTNEDYALLVGSVGLFVILGGIMFFTRGIDWYDASQ